MVLKLPDQGLILGGNNEDEGRIEKKEKSTRGEIVLLCSLTQDETGKIVHSVADYGVSIVGRTQVQFGSAESKMIIPREGQLKNFKIITNDNTFDEETIVTLYKENFDEGEEEVISLTIPKGSDGPGGQRSQLIEDNQTDVFIEENKEMVWRIDTTASSAGECEHILISMVLE